MGSDVKIARALISVTDKTGVVDFARTLVDDFGVEIISTGGTARAIEDAGVPVTPIEEFTGYPEMMDGRVKTLHPKVHGALLARRDSEQHMQEAAQHGIKLIDLVVVNLYEFEKTVANPEVTFADERGDGIAHQVERHTLTGQRPRRIAMHLNPTHATGRTRRQGDEFVAHRNRRIVQRSRHDSTDALDRKAAVNRQTRRGIGELGTGTAGIPASGNLLVERSQQAIDPLAGLGRHGHDRRACKHGT